MNSVLEKALQNNVKVDYLDPASIPVIREHREEAISYFLERLKTINRNNAEEGIDLNVWTGLFFLAENHVEEAFPCYLEILHTPGDFMFLGDLLAQDYKNLLYHTYDGHPEQVDVLLKNPEIYEYAEDAILNFINQLYLDGLVSREWLAQRYRMYGEVVKTHQLNATLFLYNAFKVRLFEISDLYYEVWKDGQYARIMFGDPLEALYTDDYPIQNPCSDYLSLEDGTNYQHPAAASKVTQLEVWKTQQDHLQKYMPAGEVFRSPSRYAYEMRTCPYPHTFKDVQEKKVEMSVMRDGTVRNPLKIGRNDPCPCGSGKKYKKCCMNKQ